jgi:hypothetical protein
MVDQNIINNPSNVNPPDDFSTNSLSLPITDQTQHLVHILQDKLSFEINAIALSYTTRLREISNSEGYDPHEVQSAIQSILNGVNRLPVDILTYCSTVEQNLTQQFIIEAIPITPINNYDAFERLNRVLIESHWKLNCRADYDENYKTLMDNILNSYRIERQQIREWLQKVETFCSEINREVRAYRQGFRSVSSFCSETLISEISENCNVIIEKFRNQIQDLIMSITNSLTIDVTDIISKVETIQHPIGLQCNHSDESEHNQEEMQQLTELSQSQRDQ